MEGPRIRKSDLSNRFLVAASNGELELCKQLLAKGAVLTHTAKKPHGYLNDDDSRASALHYAVATGDSPALVDLLICKGLDKNCRTKRLRTPLMLATAQKNPRMCRILIGKHRVDVNALDEDGNGAIHFLLGRFPAVPDGSTLEILDSLLSAGVSINARGAHQRTILLQSVHIGAVHWTHSLVNQFDADPNAADEHGDTALHMAVARKMDIEFVQFLVAKGVHPNVRNHQGLTPALRAAQFGLTSVVTYLCSQPGASFHDVDPAGIGLLHQYWRHRHQETDRKLLFVYEMVKNGVSIHERDSEQRTILHHLCLSRPLRWGTHVLIFVARYPNTTRDIDMYGCTPLHYACRYPNWNAERLLKGAADLSVRNMQGQLAFDALFRDRKRAERDWQGDAYMQAAVRFFGPGSAGFVLSLSHAQLPRPPVLSAERCANLVSISLTHCGLRALPLWAHLPKVIAVNFDDNELTELPEWLGQTRVVTFTANRNRIARIPPLPGSLRVLRLSSNCIAEIPPSLSLCSSLEVLDLSHNWFSSLPPFLAGFSRLGTLSVQQHLCPHPGPRWEEGEPAKAILAHLGTAQSEEELWAQQGNHAPVDQPHTHCAHQQRSLEDQLIPALARVVMEYLCPIEGRMLNAGERKAVEGTSSPQ